MRSFKSVLAAGTALAATTSIGVVVPLEAKATPSPGEDWAYATNAETQPCVPQVSVSDNVVDNTIRVQVSRGNTCPISNNIFLFIQDGRHQPLRIPGTRENFLSSTWIFRPGDARPGKYRVMGLNPMPSGIGDDEYISAYHLGIDQVITIGAVEMAQASTQQPQQPVAPPPPAVAASPQQVVTTLDSESKQLLMNFAQWMRWFQVNIWPKLQPLIRAIEGIKTS